MLEDIIILKGSETFNKKRIPNKELLEISAVSGD